MQQHVLHRRLLNFRLIIINTKSWSCDPISSFLLPAVLPFNICCMKNFTRAKKIQPVLPTEKERDAIAQDVLFPQHTEILYR